MGRISATRRGGLPSRLVPARKTAPSHRETDLPDFSESRSRRCPVCRASRIRGSDANGMARALARGLPEKNWLDNNVEKANHCGIERVPPRSAGAGRWASRIRMTHWGNRHDHRRRKRPGNPLHSVRPVDGHGIRPGHAGDSRHGLCNRVAADIERNLKRPRPAVTQKYSRCRPPCRPRRRGVASERPARARAPRRIRCRWPS